MITLPLFQKSICVGLLLSDGYLGLSSTQSRNARLSLKQSYAYFGYVYFTFLNLSHYCNSCPQLTKGIRLGNPYFGLQFLTRSLSCFTEIYSSFYDAKGIKRIPEDIYNLLTPVALAHLIMGDGQASVHGLILCTNSYSIKDVVRLMNVLMIRHRLDCTITLKKQNKKALNFTSIFSVRQHLEDIKRTNCVNS